MVTKYNMSGEEVGLRSTIASLRKMLIDEQRKSHDLETSLSWYKREYGRLVSQIRETGRPKTKKKDRPTYQIFGATGIQAFNECKAELDRWDKNRQRIAREYLNKTFGHQTGNKSYSHPEPVDKYIRRNSRRP